jgi:competence protein ComEC
MNSLMIHFLNVGHGDCTIIEFPDHLTMVDINNSRALDHDTRQELEDKIARRYGLEADLAVSRAFGLGTPLRIAHEICRLEEGLTDPIDFFISHYGRRPIFRYIQSHPDMDHMSGLYRLHVQEKIPISNFWDTYHSVEKPEDAGPEGRFDMRDWETYKKLRRSTEAPKALFYKMGQKNQYYTSNGIRIWAPAENSPTNESSDLNALSYVLRIQFGACNILLGGDAPASVWEGFHQEFSNRADCNYKYPKVNLFKAPHHGRKSGYHWPSVRSMSPDVTVVSVGELAAKDDASENYAKYSNVGCFSTREYGNLSAQCWEDGDIWLYGQEGQRIVSSLAAKNAVAV